MKVHHLNCGTMRPVATPGGLVCHVLAVETDNGLVLVDSGYGLADRAGWRRRMGPSKFLSRPDYAPEETALRQLPRLGLDPADVRHIVLTHFDADHAGGISDFPHAQVHLTADEATGALQRKTVTERLRYLPGVRDHDPILVQHSPSRAEPWRGFPAAKELTEIAPGIVLIALPGHTRGHAAIAVDAGEHWVLHVGDSFYHHGQIDGCGGAPRTLTLLERSIAHDWSRVRANHATLAGLWAAADPDLLLVNAHDPDLLRKAQGR